MKSSRIQHNDNESTNYDTNEIVVSETTFDKIIDKPLYLVGSFEVWSLGITTVIGGQYYGWNTNLTSGFGIAEVGSAISFPGGCYGLARVILGFYPGIISVTLIVIYCFGSLGWVNISRFGPFDDNKVHHVWFNGGMSAFLCNLASGTTSGFGGIESLALIISYMKDPLKNFQEGAITSVLTLFFINIMLLIVMASLPSGLSYTSQQTYPMNEGYNLIFQWPDVVSSIAVIPANYAMGFGFFLSYGKLLQCLADSDSII
eukprot:gene27141-35650_t